MSLKSCIKAALGLSDQDTNSVLDAYDRYKAAGMYGKGSDLAAVEDVIESLTAELNEYEALIEENYPEFLKEARGQDSFTGMSEEELNNAGIWGKMPEMLKRQSNNVPTMPPVIEKAAQDISDEAIARTTKSWDGVKAGFLRVLTLDAVSDLGAPAFEGISKAIYRAKGVTEKYGNNAVLAYQELVRRQQHEAAAMTARAKEHDQRHRVMESKDYKGGSGAVWMERLGDLMNAATIAGMHPDKNFNDPDNSHMVDPDDDFTTKINEEKHEELQQQYEALPKDFKDEYHTMQQFYKDQFATLRASSVENLVQVFGNDRFNNPRINKFIKDLVAAKDAETVNNAVQEARKEFLKDTGADEETKAVYKKLLDGEKDLKRAVGQMNRFEKKAGPYFPLKRFGKYQMKGTDPATGEKYYWRSDDKAELQETREQLQKAGVEINNINPVDPTDYNFSSRNISAVLEEALGNLDGSLENRNAAVSAITRAFAAVAPETSMQKHFMTRKNTLGAANSVRRNMASYSQAAAWSQASLKYGKDIRTALGTMRKAQAMSKNDEQAMKMGNIANELTRRTNERPQAAGILMAGAAQYSFLNYLMSFSYSMVNSTQVAVVTLPRMAEKYGTGESLQALKEAYKLAAPMVWKATKEAKFGLQALTAEGVSLDSTITNVLSRVDDPYVADMLKTLRARDMLGGGLTFDVTESAKGKGRGKLGGAFNAAIEMGRTMPMMVEELNRIVTALATYNMAKAKGRTHEDAIADAERMIIKTHFDYTDLNKPPVFTKNDVLRAITTYKMHPLGLYMNMWHYIDGIKDADPEVRKNARKGMALFMGMHGLFAGAAGGLLLEPISIALQAIAATMDDDDELKPLFSDPDLLVREAAYAITGNAKASEVLTYGAPRMFGVDMYSRIGLHRGMVQIVKGETAFDTMIDSMVASATGPIFSIKDQWKNMAAHMAAGDDFWGSASYALPKAFRDFIRAAQLQSEGMQDFRGNTIMPASEFTPLDVLTKGIGFGTSTEAEVYSNRNRNRSRVKSLRKTKTKLTRRYLAATPAERNRLFRGEIREFNRALTPKEIREYRIDRGKLLMSEKRQRERERDTRGGVYSKDNRGIKYPYSTVQ